MPITITPPWPGTSIGPGYVIQLNSDFFGPLPVGSWFDLSVFSGAAHEDQMVYARQSTQQHTARLTVGGYGNDLVNTYRTDLALPAAGTSVAIQTHLNDTTGTVDSGTTTLQWDPVGGIAAQNVALAAQGSGGLDATQAAQLEQASTQTNQLLGLDPTYPNDTIATVQLVLGSVLDGITAQIGPTGATVAASLGSLFSGNTMDNLTEDDLGTACHPDILEGDLPIGLATTGLEIDVLSWPAYFTFTTWAEDYCIQTFADVRLARGSGVLVRMGLHETSKLFYPMPGFPNLFAFGQSLPVDPGGYHYKITPAEGVCVNAKRLHLP